MPTLEQCTTSISLARPRFGGHRVTASVGLRLSGIPFEGVPLRRVKSEAGGAERFSKRCGFRGRRGRGSDIMNIRWAIAVVVGIAFAAVPVGVAWADTVDYPPSAPTVALLLSSAPCDANVSANGDDWQPGSTIDLTRH